MLEMPGIPEESINACLQQEYGLHVRQVDFLPLGADQDAAVYKVLAAGGAACFFKLKGGAFDETSVTLPSILHKLGVAQVIPPLPTLNGQLWAELAVYKTILYPFIPGRNGYEVSLTDQHWIGLGQALKRIHSAVLPPALRRRIAVETYNPHWRELTKQLLANTAGNSLPDAPAVKTAALLAEKGAEILDLVSRAEYFAGMLQAHPPRRVLCHSDLHAGNILVGDDGAFYIVDWDAPILAPKERDLMYPGGAQGFSGHTPQEEETLFFQGYGRTRINRAALAYYRYERIVQDIAIFSEQLLLSAEGGEDREQSYIYLASNFLPGGTIEMARRSDSLWQAGQPLADQGA